MLRYNAVPRVCVVVYALYIAAAVNYFLSQQVVGDAARPSHAESRLM